MVSIRPAGHDRARGPRPGDSSGKGGAGVGMGSAQQGALLVGTGTDPAVPGRCIDNDI